MAGYKVYASDIKKGGNFLNLKVDYDCIVTNPPYSKKLAFLERAYELGKVDEISSKESRLVASLRVK